MKWQLKSIELWGLLIALTSLGVNHFGVDMVAAQEAAAQMLDYITKGVAAVGIVVAGYRRWRKGDSSGG